MRTEPIYRERLAKLADFLDTVPPEKFAFYTVMDIDGLKDPLEALAAGSHPCGTVGCAIGWTPAVFPESLVWQSRCEYSTMLDVNLKESPVEAVGRMNFSETVSGRAAMQFFGIDTEELYYLFIPHGKHRYNNLGDNAQPHKVAAHIRSFLEEQT